MATRFTSFQNQEVKDLYGAVSMLFNQEMTGQQWWNTKAAATQGLQSELATELSLRGLPIPNIQNF